MAYNVSPAKPRHCLDLGREVVHLKAGDVVQVTDYLHTYFTAGSAASYALEYNRCPVESYNDAVARGHKTHWLNQRGSALTLAKREPVKAVSLALGDEVWFEGRLFRLDRAANRNVNLVELAR